MQCLLSALMHSVMWHWNRWIFSIHNFSGMWWLVMSFHWCTFVKVKKKKNGCWLLVYQYNSSVSSLIRRWFAGIIKHIQEHWFTFHNVWFSCNISFRFPCDKQLWNIVLFIIHTHTHTIYSILQGSGECRRYKYVPKIASPFAIVIHFRCKYAKSFL